MCSIICTSVLLACLYVKLRLAVLNRVILTAFQATQGHWKSTTCLILLLTLWLTKYSKYTHVHQCVFFYIYHKVGMITWLLIPDQYFDSKGALDPEEVGRAWNLWHLIWSEDVDQDKPGRNAWKSAKKSAKMCWNKLFIFLVLFQKHSALNH